MNGTRGHRVTWAIFNTVLLEDSRSTGSLVHRQSHQGEVLTKKAATDLMTERENLVQTVSARGADIRTTPMAWKREGNHLEWIVRQMSWQPPWCTGRKPSVAEQVLTQGRARKADTPRNWTSKIPWLDGVATPPLILGQHATASEDKFDDDGASTCLLYTSPSPRDLSTSRMPSSA